MVIMRRRDRLTIPVQERLIRHLIVGPRVAAISWLWLANVYLPSSHWSRSEFVPKVDIVLERDSDCPWLSPHSCSDFPRWYNDPEKTSPRFARAFSLFLAGDTQHLTPQG